ncbi:hypothetical protein [Pseudopedobacter beijingensis]|uniref:LTXXQ motif family protein n=1 Tax=Pseudopedobacter beijingensis TaxID=1207056 RepID=A0ABW4IGA7_9SPHI
MKRSFLVGGLLFMLSFTVIAQSKTVFLHKQETMDILGLNQVQQMKITTLTKQSFQDITKVKKDTELSESEKKSKISGIYKKRQQEYEATLTPEQLKKYNELKAAAKNQQ